MPVVRVNGADFHTMVLGDDGPLIVMLHGLVVGSIATWCFQFAPSLAQRYRVLLFDMRSHGKSERVASGFDLDTMATDLCELIRYYRDTLGVAENDVHLVGHSYGALVALHYALHRERLGGPEVASMVIVDAPVPASKYIYPGMAAMQSDEQVEEGARKIIAHLGIEGRRRQAKLIDHVRYLYRETTLKGDIGAAGDIADELITTLPMPVLLVYGEHSDCLSSGQRLAALIPDSKLKTLPCGHYITMEQPDVLSSEINRHFGVGFDG